MHWLILVLGVFSNALASVMIKVAVSQPRKFPSLTEPISALTNWPFWVGLFFYGVAFLLYASALAKFPLNVAHPVLTAGAVAMVALLSVVIFKEPISWASSAGIVLVIIGVVLITAPAR